MAKIDEVKEILNTLRLFFSISIGLVVVLTGSLKDRGQDTTHYFQTKLFLVLTSAKRVSVATLKTSEIIK